MNTQPQPNSKQLQRWEEKNIWLLESPTYSVFKMLDFLINITEHAKKQYSTAHGAGGRGGAVTLAETATDEKQTSIVLNTKG